MIATMIQLELWQQWQCPPAALVLAPESACPQLHVKINYSYQHIGHISINKYIECIVQHVLSIYIVSRPNDLTPLSLYAQLMYSAV
jgi:hypothetical protein